MKVDICGKEFLIDDEDGPKISGLAWHIQKASGYAIHSVSPTEKLLMHRFVMGCHGKDIQVDHINGDRSDNRKENLRFCTPTGNARNAKRKITNKSGYKGVFKHKRSRGWTAQICVDRKKKHLGTFDTKEKAHAAYCEAAKKFFKEFARSE